MRQIEYGMEKQAARYHEVLTDHETIIRTALQVYVERMEEAAKEADAAYKAGQADPELKAQQDKSFVTNHGYKVSAQMFRESAESARKASTDLLNAVLGIDEDDEQG
ncbi:hypothetical protein SEA_SUCCESS_75 [Streptomyces phage Success]|uniref:Uncharacterized protein n=1 Tax=Streptomyces phage Success TaxID=2999013 RepID=A0A9E8S3T0_9CAUD|nr:hypothetical protein QEH47_gp57 [Streptomyces phage Success]WAB08854.1 hypothetical protein SEA_SUCCESS_75 [Streptomyces phage Success]